MLVRVAAVARNDSSSKCCNSTDGYKTKINSRLDQILSNRAPSVSILHRLNLQISVAWGQVIISSRGQGSNLCLLHRQAGVCTRPCLLSWSSNSVDKFTIRRAIILSTLRSF